MEQVTSILKNKMFIAAILITNIFGTIYGYIWYKEQLLQTPLKYMLFVPDSPTASLFFVFVLVGLLLGRNLPYIEAFAIVTLVKYGAWAMIMNFLLLIVTGSLSWQGYMLIASHGAMAIQGILYFSEYQIKLRHLAIASIWILHNDVIDYLFRMMPQYGVLDQYMMQIGYFTFWLSIATILFVYFVCVRKPNLSIPK